MRGPYFGHILTSMTLALMLAAPLGASAQDSNEPGGVVMGSFCLRSHSRLRCLRLLPLRRRPTSCAKLSERARLITVAPTLSPMPSGRPLSGASGTAEFASSAIAFRRIDYWLKPRRNASASSDWFRCHATPATHSLDAVADRAVV